MITEYIIRENGLKVSCEVDGVDADSDLGKEIDAQLRECACLISVKLSLKNLRDDNA